MNDETSSADATTRRLDTAALELLAANAKTVGVAAPAPGALNLERTGDWIGRYKLIEELGEGGFGVVWRAEQTEPIHREVALKVIRPGMDSREIIARFAAEQQALALMDHPNIAAVLDAGATDNGRPYFVMELVKGVPITTYCDEHKLTIRQRLELFIPVCQAVQHAHQKAILHRDLKPSNILVMEVDGKPVPKVIDFGIAKALGSSGELALQASLMRTQEGMVIGTPQYMSPEQAGSMPDVDTRSDIYTLGVILYELLTGNTPIPLDQLKQAALDQVLRLIREGETKRPSSSLLPLSEAVKLRATDRSSDPKKISAILRGDIDWIVLKALEKERERRYDSANALAEDIQHHLQNEPVNAGPPSAAYRFRKLVQRNKLLVAASVAVLVCLLAGVAATGYALLLEQRARKQAVENEARAQKMLREASRSDYATAHEHLGKGEWSKGVAYLGRSVRYDPANRMARGALWQTLMNGQSDAEKLPIHSLEHHGEVIVASFSPDGTRVVTSSYNKPARIWDTETGRPITDFMLHTGGVTSAMFSPDGTRVVTGSHDKTARLWDAANWKPLGSVMEHMGYVLSAVFSPDGTRILTLGDNKTARLWDGKTGHSIGTPMQAWDRDSAKFSPDGKCIITCCDDQTIRLWDGMTGKPLNTVLELQRKEGRAHPTKVYFNIDGSRLITVSDKKTVQLWDAATYQLLCTLSEHESLVSVRFSPDGTRFVTADGGRNERPSAARIWDCNTGLLIGNVMVHAGGGVNDVAFSPDGTRILTGSLDKTARQWDAATGQPIGPPMVHEQWVLRVSYNRDGTHILTASGDDYDRNHGSVKIWAASTGHLVNHPLIDTRNTHFDSAIISANFSLDGTRIVAAAGKNRRSAQLWNSETGQPIGTAMQHAGFVVSAMFSPDGWRVVTGSKDKTARIWDGFSGKPVGKTLNHQGEINGAVFSRDGNLILTASDDKTARVWDGKTGEPIGSPMKHTGKVTSANFSPDSTFVVSSSDDKTARLWDAKSGQPIGEVMTHNSAVGGAIFSPDGTKVVTAAMAFFEAAQLLWDARTGKPIGQAMDIKDWVHASSFSPDGNRIATALGRSDVSSPGSARLWDAETGRPMGAIMPHKKMVEISSFSPDGKLVVTAGYETAARLWDGSSGQPFGMDMHDTGSNVSFSPDGKRLIGSGGRDGAARLREIRTDQALGSIVAEDVAAFSSGLRLDPALGTLTRLSHSERMLIWDKISEMLSTPGLSDWKFAGECHLPAPNPDSPCSPRMTVSRREMLDRMIMSSTPELVHEAQAADPGNPLLPYALAAIEESKSNKTDASAIRADFLRRYGKSRITAELAKDPASAAGYVALARQFRSLAESQRSDILLRGKSELSTHRSIELLQLVADTDPANVEWQLELATSFKVAGEIRWLRERDLSGIRSTADEIVQHMRKHEADKIAETEAYYLKALRIMERLKKSGQRPAQDTLEDAIQKNLDLVRKAQGGQPPGIK